MYAGVSHGASVMDSSAVSETLLRMQYAMAVIRVVNGIADSAQKGKVASSVASLASFAGDAQLARASSLSDEVRFVSSCQIWDAQACGSSSKSAPSIRVAETRWTAVAQDLHIFSANLTLGTL